jgi:hypothetical protein
LFVRTDLDSAIAPDRDTARVEEMSVNELSTAAGGGWGWAAYIPVSGSEINTNAYTFDLPSFLLHFGFPATISEEILLKYMICCCLIDSLL